MKRNDLIRKIRRTANARGAGFELKRQGSNHEQWICGQTPVWIPRHRELNELTAQSILQALEGELGERWWR